MKKSSFTRFTGISLTLIVTSIGYSQGPISSLLDVASTKAIISSFDEKKAAKNAPTEGTIEGVVPKPL